MSLLKNLLDYALNYYYPRKKVDDDTPSKTDMWEEWFASEYINGQWYIGSSVNPVVKSIDRSILKAIYLYDTDTGKYGIGLITKNFHNGQVINLKIKNTFYTMGADTTGKVGKLLLNNSFDNISVSSEESVINHIKYNKLDTIIFNTDDLCMMSYNDFITNYEDIVKMLKVYTSRQTTNPYPTFKVKFDIVNHSKGVANFYRNGNIDYSTSFSKDSNEVSFTTLLKYDYCELVFDDGLLIRFNIDTMNNHDWTIKEIIFKYMEV